MNVQVETDFVKMKATAVNFNVIGNVQKGNNQQVTISHVFTLG